MAWASEICFHTGRMRVAQSAVVGCTAGAAWNAAAVEAKKTIDVRILATSALAAAVVTMP